MGWSVGSEAADAPGLIMVLEERGGPGVWTGAKNILCPGDSAFERRKCVVFWGRLEFVRALADIDHILEGIVLDSRDRAEEYRMGRGY